MVGFWSWAGRGGTAGDTPTPTPPHTHTHRGFWVPSGSQDSRLTVTIHSLSDLGPSSHPSVPPWPHLSNGEGACPPPGLGEAPAAPGNPALDTCVGRPGSAGLPDDPGLDCPAPEPPSPALASSAAGGGGGARAAQTMARDLGAGSARSGAWRRAPAGVHAGGPAAERAADEVSPSPAGGRGGGAGGHRRGREPRRGGTAPPTPGFLQGGSSVHRSEAAGPFPAPRRVRGGGSTPGPGGTPDRPRFLGWDPEPVHLEKAQGLFSGTTCESRCAHLTLWSWGGEGVTLDGGEESPLGQ